MSHVGPLTVERHALLKRQGQDLHVFVGGEDVTDRCRFADDTPGDELAVLYRLTADGRKHLDEDGRPAMIVVDRDIEIREVS